MLKDSRRRRSRRKVSTTLFVVGSPSPFFDALCAGLIIIRIPFERGKIDNGDVYGRFYKFVKTFFYFLLLFFYKSIFLRVDCVCIYADGKFIYAQSVILW